MTSLEYREISNKDATSFLLPLHYSGRKPQLKYSFGAYAEDVLVAVCTYGIPASRSLCVGVLGKELASSVIELNRLCRLDCMTTPLSEFVGWTLRELKKHSLCVVSYADTAMQHTGSIYQACNFLYTGKTQERTDKYTPNGKHSRHYTDEYNHLRKVRSGKHRYIYFATNKTIKKAWLSKLKYTIEEYPKGEKHMYPLGEYLKSVIYDKDKKEYYYE